MSYTEKEIRELGRIAATLRGNLIEMIPPGKVGHLGGSSSIMDIVAALYFKHMNVFDDPKDPRRDRCIFSKGHAVLAQSAAFAELGYVSHEDLHKSRLWTARCRATRTWTTPRASRPSPVPWARA